MKERMFFEGVGYLRVGDWIDDWIGDYGMDAVIGGRGC